MKSLFIARKSKLIIKRIKQLQLINRNRAWLKSPISHYEKVIYYPNATTAFLLAIFRKNDYRIRYLGSNFYYDNFYAPLSLQAYPHEIGNILDNVDKNIKHVLDIGGNVGQFSKTLSHIHKEVKIDIFEPNMKIYPYLQKNLKHNKKIRLWNVGIGPAKKSMKLNFENGKSATGSFIVANASNSAGAKLERIPVSLISDPAQLTRRKNYDLVKIDVEGYEYEALKYLGKNIKTKYLFVEVSGIGRYKNFKHSSLFSLIKKQFGDFDIVYQSKASVKDATMEFLFKFV